jgi:probable F420-dependent oxidoreductase
MLNIGVVFPGKEITDPGGVRDFVQAAEDLGYSHLLMHDHVLGVDVTHCPDLDLPKKLKNFHEAFVLLGFIAALTRRIELVTGVLVLTQRQTALVAKQAAELDCLSSGRLRLGVGIGYVEPEFQSLNAEFHDRGRRCEEQIAVMRALWTQEVVTFHGQWHDIEEMGLRPLPVQQPIPIWLGGWSDASFRRVVCMADGWMTADDAKQTASSGFVDRLRSFALDAGRDPATIGIDGYVEFPARGLPPIDSAIEDCRRDVVAWEELGASHVSVHTMDWAGVTSTVQAHIDAITRFKELV